MRILLATPKFPYPPDTGGRIVVLRTLEWLGKLGHEVHLLARATDEDLEEHRKELESLCSFHPLLYHSRSRVRDLLGALATGSPYLVYRYDHPEVVAAAGRISERKSVDVALVEFLGFAPKVHELRQACQAPVVIRAHNVESQLLERYGEQYPVWSPRRWLLAYEERKTRVVERGTLPAFDRVVALTDPDARRLKSLAPEARLEVVAPGVDVPDLPGTCRDEEPDLVFLGTMSWPPNEEGIGWFLTEVWPHIRDAPGRPRLFVVGHDPPGWLANLEDRRVVVTGYVERLDEYLRPRNVFVIPLLSGSGIRIKALEAMAAGMPVVSTSVGVEGIAVEDGVHLLKADTPEAFARTVTGLLGDRERAAELGARARNLVLERYSWRAQMERLARVLKDTVQGHPGSR